MTDPGSARRVIVGPLHLVTLARLGPPGAAPDSLLLPSGETVLLNPEAARILALCDGTRTAVDIAAQCGADRRDATLDFLSAALAMGWIRAPSEPRQ